MDVETALQQIPLGGGQQVRYLLLLCLFKIYAAFHTLQYSFVGRTSPFTCQSGNQTLADMCPGNLVSGCSVITFQEKTIVSEWSLVCDKNWLGKATMSVLMLGFLVGALVLGRVADRVGRKSTLMLVLLGLIICNYISSSTDIFTVYMISRFLVGFFVSGQAVVLSVFVSELVGPSYRGVFGMAILLSYPVGIIALAATASYYQDWRDLGHLVSVLGMPFLTLHWYLVESPVWLVTQNRLREAEAALATMTNDKSKLVASLKTAAAAGRAEEVRHESVLQLFSNKKVSLITMVLCYNWMVNGATYYGMTLAAAAPDQGMDIYTGTAWSGAVEIPAVLLAYYAIEQGGRRVAMVGFMTGCGGASLMVHFFSGSILPILGPLFGLLGKMCIAGSFKIAYIISGEIFPTSIRTSSMGMVSAMARVGSTISPFIVMLGETVPGFQFDIFAFLALSGGFLSLRLPETKGKKLPSNVADMPEDGKQKTFTV